MQYPKELVDAYLLSNNELIQKERLEWTIDWLRHASIVWVDDKEYIRRRWRILQSTWKVWDKGLSYRNDNISSPDIIEEKVTTNETQWVHEIKYEWWQIITKQQFFQHIDFDEVNSEILSYQTNVRQVVLRTWPNETTLVNKYEHFLRTKPYKWINMDKILEKISSAIEWYDYDPNYENNFEEIRWSKALQICLFDAHINKKSFSWWERNCNIARQVYTSMVRNMCMKWLSYCDDIEEVVLVIGQDFFNSDTQSKTTSWTPQDNVENEEDSFEAWLNIIMESISIIKDYIWCKINIISVPWNHARLLEQVLWTSISAIYRNDHMVNVDYSQANRKYWSFWLSTILLCHWDGAKKETYPMIFATERPDLRSSSKYREVHQWHIHHQTVSEINWVIVRTLSSTTTTDRWHDKNNFCFSIRWWQMFIWDKINWNEAQFNFYI